TNLLYILYFSIKFSLFLVSIVWFFFHGWYAYKGIDSTGDDVYYLIGLLKYCSVNQCIIYSPRYKNIFYAWRILCFYYIISLILESILAIISVRCLQCILPCMILSIHTVVSFIIFYILSICIYFREKSSDGSFQDTDENIFYMNSVNFSFWNITNAPLSLLNFACLLCFFMIRRERQKRVRV
ncbi:hypothetical protein HZS_2027, partial [Henneguya salminicola]